MKPSEILIKAKSLIDTPEKWTQLTEARDANGNAVTVGDSGAVCFCSMGAVIKSLGVKPSSNLSAALSSAVDALVVAMDNTEVEDFNDTHTHAEVMEAWDEAIKIAKEKENEGV